MEFQNPPDLKRTVFGEGAVHPMFLGSVYMQNEGESGESAAWRFNEAMKSIGFEWLADRRNS